jgi:hypothetical protein
MVRTRRAVVNAHATVTLMTDDELGEIGATVYRGYLDDDPPWWAQDQPSPDA